MKRVTVTMINPGQITIFDDFCGFSSLLMDRETLHSDARTQVISKKENGWTDSQIKRKKTQPEIAKKDNFYPRLRQSSKYATVSFGTVVYKTPASIAELGKAAE